MQLRRAYGSRLLALLVGSLAFGTIERPMGAAGAEATADIGTLKQAATRGSADALFRLGDMYETGKGVEHDLTMAAAYMRLAAHRGAIRARYRLGMSYAGGLGVPRNLVRSYRWLTLARTVDPEHDIGLLAESMRDAVAGMMSREEIARAKKQVAEFRPLGGPAALPTPETAAAAANRAIALATIDEVKRLVPRTDCGPAQVRKADSGRIRVAGFAAAGRQGAVLTNAAGAYFKRHSVDFDIAEVSPVICDVINVLAARPGRLDGGPDVVLRDETGSAVKQFREGSYLVIDIPGPREAGYLNVDYITGDGDAIHLYPSGPSVDNFRPAGKRLVLGRPNRGGEEWQISPPFGTDLLVAFVSRRRLHGGRRPGSESVSDYLRFLSRRLSSAAPGDAIGIRYLVVKSVAQRK